MQFSSKLTLFTAAALQLLVSSGAAAPTNGSTTAVDGTATPATDDNSWSLYFYTTTDCSSGNNADYVEYDAWSCHQINDASGASAYEYDVNPAGKFTIWLYGSTDCSGGAYASPSDHDNLATCYSGNIQSFSVDSGSD
ncbi:MAG: hypothetical protein M1819_003740 [Sarea resinae]|nr:MAG: hypothetical protein M1819_003740 [Sarea resinae]